MYEHLRGRLDTKTPVNAVVDVGGIGFSLSIPLSTFDRLPSTGEGVLLYTDLVVREDAHRLFGFASREERALFRMLLGVSGVGPAVALAIVSDMDLGTFRETIGGGDAARLRRVKGVGKRLSERLVVELRDALGGSEPLVSGTSEADGGAQLVHLSIDPDVDDFVGIREPEVPHAA